MQISSNIYYSTECFIIQITDFIQIYKFHLKHFLMCLLTECEDKKCFYFAVSYLIWNCLHNDRFGSAVWEHQGNDTYEAAGNHLETTCMCTPVGHSWSPLGSNVLEYEECITQTRVKWWQVHRRVFRGNMFSALQRHAEIDIFM